MDPVLRKFLGEGPYPAPENRLPEVIDVRWCRTLCVLVGRAGLEMPAITHAHASYEFMTPVSPLAPIRVGGRRMSAPEGRTVPLNSHQDHGPTEVARNSRLVSFQIDEQYLNHIARAMGAREEVAFDNTPTALRPEIHRLLQSFLREAREPRPGGTFIMDSLSTELTVEVLRHLASNLPSPLAERPYTARPNIDRAIAFLRDNFSRDYSMTEVAGVANLSPYHFIRVFKAETGKTPYEYVLGLKVEKAQELLRSLEHSVTEVCYLCGFNNPSHFAAVFRKKVGVSPSEYRRALSGH